MLIPIQRKLSTIECPSCGKTPALEASLSCSRDEEECQPMCHCKHCGLTLRVGIPEDLKSMALEFDSFDMICDLKTHECFLQLRLPTSSTNPGLSTHKAAG